MTIFARAHGRVNLIGEHTDYNHGWVLPTAIPQYTEVALEKGEGESVMVTAGRDPASGEERNFLYRLGEEHRSGEWHDYLQGATKLLREAGHPLGGFSARISSSVPEGSGLSSSAALEISFLKALREAFSLSLTDLELARIGQRIENEFVGARVGIMDQVACAIAEAGEALFLDTHDLSFERVSIPTERMEIAVINSGISHRHSDGGYNRRREECEEAAKLLGVKTLRELPPGADLSSLPDPLNRRVRHVLSENVRVHQAVDGLKKGDGELVGRLFLESHGSLRDDYEVSVPEVDLLVSLFAKEEGVFGARMTGGGFGGSVLALVEAGRGGEVARRVKNAYEEQTGERATLLVPEVK